MNSKKLSAVNSEMKSVGNKDLDSVNSMVKSNDKKAGKIKRKVTLRVRDQLKKLSSTNVDCSDSSLSRSPDKFTPRK